MRFHSHFRKEPEAGHCVVIANANAYDTANYGRACWQCINMRAKFVSAFTSSTFDPEGQCSLVFVGFLFVKVSITPQLFFYTFAWILHAITLCVNIHLHFKCEPARPCPSLSENFFSVKY